MLANITDIGTPISPSVFRLCPSLFNTNPAAPYNFLRNFFGSWPTYTIKPLVYKNLVFFFSD
ncbi:hypothetical protein MtrunA17_Chr5g0402861 [Medicago truncatula]|uniref:Uncharacterized protein n=1 Tax=Medicago truncatula TaxID=3880 RepID=A0A396HLA3_MEDTR|nr:hypothetical protein MtrunA17_Chr5g0402861 [Medicago truncatula]